MAVQWSRNLFIAIKVVFRPNNWNSMRFCLGGSVHYIIFKTKLFIKTGSIKEFFHLARVYIHDCTLDKLTFLQKNILVSVAWHNWEYSFSTLKPPSPPSRPSTPIMILVTHVHSYVEKGPTDTLFLSQELKSALVWTSLFGSKVHYSNH